MMKKIKGNCGEPERTIPLNLTWSIDFETLVKIQVDPHNDCSTISI